MESILVVGAHPDDCEFGAGGTTFEWAARGSRVEFLIVTDGAAGSAGCQTRPQDLVSLRRGEQEEAAALLGVARCHYLGHPDGQVENDAVLRERLVRILRELRPRAVFTHTPEHLDHRRFQGGDGSWINHRDHRAVGAAVLDAIYPLARNPNSFPDCGPAHKVESLYLWGSRFPDTHLPCPDGMKAKARALACHRTQFGPEIDWEALIAGWGETEPFERIVLP